MFLAVMLSHLMDNQQHQMFMELLIPIQPSNKLLANLPAQAETQLQELLEDQLELMELLEPLESLEPLEPTDPLLLMEIPDHLATLELLEE